MSLTNTNTNMQTAKNAKNDEFYTQYDDIQSEVNAYLEYDADTFRGKTVLLPCDDPEWSNFTRFFAQNFETFGLKKLISTSYAFDSKRAKYGKSGYYQPSLLEITSPEYKEDTTAAHGKIFTLTRDANASGRIDIDDLEWDYLKGDGDFQSDEVKALRDEADIIVTNPPFSLFRDFVAWMVEAKKKFLILGNKNAITYKDIFSLIQQNKLWVGTTPMSKEIYFDVPQTFIEASLAKHKHRTIVSVGGKYMARSSAIWFTNLDHGRRHQPLQLMTMEDNIKFSRHKGIKGQEYLEYDNYNAIDVPFTDAIPADYAGVMGVPVSFLDKYNPEQFEIKGLDRYVDDNPHYGHRFTIEGKETYARILIRRK